jgi:GNAT superfamily N-acetyltransferase
MSKILYRLANESDVLAMARIRAADWETGEYWSARITRYLSCEQHPAQALLPRVSYVAAQGDALLGFIAGHLTRRFACDGELQWIDVVAQRRRQGVAAELLTLLAAWFVQQDASRICVDVQPTNVIARRFYARFGAVELNPHWLVWPDIKVVLERS